MNIDVGTTIHGPSPSGAWTNVNECLRSKPIKAEISQSYEIYDTVVVVHRNKPADGKQKQESSSAENYAFATAVESMGVEDMQRTPASLGGSDRLASRAS